MNVFETATNELRELVDLVRRTTEWDMSVVHGRVKLEEVPPEALATHRAKTERLAVLCAKYGI
ncbi:hypothetical protein [Burkholderia pseudomultivorans]|uniref:hypothetical protein n=1 Tax=Burkholderia pseudomultivorans TaxID=1207504 RepID=UPI001E384BB6|nr:hypothetical protein [Burkholderia pseudomultivorans]